MQTDREENLARLASFNINKNNPHYLHYVSYHDELLKVINEYAKGDLLDIGCGNKPYEKWFDGLVTKYVGVDVIQSNLNKVDIIALANEIPIEDASFNTIMSNQVIEHVEDHQGLCNEAFRLLKPGGYFILSGPFCWPLHEEPYDFFRFSKHGFKFILENAGFEVIKITANGGMWANAGLSLIHALEATQAKNFRMRVLISLYHRLNLRKTINRIFHKMDTSHFNEFNTINYVVVAKKN